MLSRYTPVENFRRVEERFRQDYRDCRKRERSCNWRMRIRSSQIPCNRRRAIQDIPAARQALRKPAKAPYNTPCKRTATTPESRKGIPPHTGVDNTRLSRESTAGTAAAVGRDAHLIRRAFQCRYSSHNTRREALHRERREHNAVARHLRPHSNSKRLQRRGTRQAYQGKRIGLQPAETRILNRINAHKLRSGNTSGHSTRVLLTTDNHSYCRYSIQL